MQLHLHPYPHAGEGQNHILYIGLALTENTSAWPPLLNIFFISIQVGPCGRENWDPRGSFCCAIRKNATLTPVGGLEAREGCFRILPVFLWLKFLHLAVIQFLVCLPLLPIAGLYMMSSGSLAYRPINVSFGPKACKSAPANLNVLNLDHCVVCTHRDNVTCT